MRAAILVALAVVAAAAPAPEPPIATVTQVVDITKYVYEDGTPVEEPVETEAPKWGGKPDYGNWGPPAAAPEPVAAAPVPETYEPAPAPAAPQAPAGGSYSGAGQATPADYSEAVVAHHNAHRANHSAPALSWDAGLAATAEKIASSCVYAHDTATDGGGYGQNIAAGAPASNISSVITELFYNNEVENFASLFGQSTPSNINDHSAFDGWGHFSQIVWKSTTKIGCATYDCSGRGLANTGGSVPPHFTVCNYSPAGNFLGEFAENVGQSLGYPSISWEST